MFWNQTPDQGCSGEIWSKFSRSLAGWCITDSLSHTTYVETNEERVNIELSECFVFDLLCR